MKVQGSCHCGQIAYEAEIDCLKQKADLPPKRRIWCRSALAWAQNVSSIPGIDHQ